MKAEIQDQRSYWVSDHTLSSRDMMTRVYRTSKTTACVHAMGKIPRLQEVTRRTKSTGLSA